MRCSISALFVLVSLWGASEATYHGHITSDAKSGTEVELDNNILERSRNFDEVCGYTTYKSRSELPFKVVFNKVTQETKIVLEDGYQLDFEKQHSYRFEIAAHDCETGRHAPRTTVRIEVEKSVVKVTTTTTTSTEAKKVANMIEVVEGKLYDEIMRLQVPNNAGCRYQLLTNDVPFRIDSDGVLYNTEPLDYSERHNYILEAKPNDCFGETKLDKTMINIAVTKECSAGWEGIEDFEYTPGSGRQILGVEADLDTCDDECKPSQVSATVKLSSDVDKECSVDKESLEARHKQCGVGGIDLLANKDEDKEEGVVFDGKSSGFSVLKVNHTLSSEFTVMSWVKHAGVRGKHNNVKHAPKEHILCNSDGEDKNRVHYSLFMHNCRLVLLLRQEATGANLNVFKPAEWRWDLDQVCDGDWHHYAVVVDFPQVRLYVDGKLNAGEKPEVIDDWPLHRTNTIKSTKLAVGGCWEGGESKLESDFKGRLAGLTVLRGTTEPGSALDCLTNCRERFEFHAMDEMKTGMSVALNSEMTEITINGRNTGEVSNLVRRISYYNPGPNPTTGERNIMVSTQVTCEKGRQLEIPVSSTKVTVAKVKVPTVEIAGSPMVARPVNELQRGVRPLGDVLITSDDVDEVALDSCSLRGIAMNLELEHLKYPENLVKQLGLEASADTNGLIISGVSTVPYYQEILRQIVYVNQEPEDFNVRVLTLVCSQLNGKFVSNEFKVTIDVIRQTHHANVPQAHMESNKLPSVEQYKQFSLNEHGSTAHSASTGVGVTVIVVVCVGFLLFMIVLGVIRIRATHQRNQGGSVEERAAEMEWDNSALSITVNPMDQETAYEESHELVGTHGGGSAGAMLSDSEDEDMSDEYQDEDEEDDDMESSEDEEEQEVCVKVRDRDLEWDDSTLNF